LNPTVRYRVDMGPPQVLVLSQMYPIHTLPPYFSKIRSNFFSSRLGLPSGLFRFSDQIFYAFLISLVRATCPTLLILLDLIILIIFCEAYQL